MKTLLTLIIVVVGFIYFSSCEYVTVPPPSNYVPPVDTNDTVKADTVKFSKEIAPLFVDYSCTGCHGGGVSPDLRTNKSYNSLTNGYVTKPSATSKLMVKINIKPKHNNTDKFTPAQKARIAKWIDDGAPNF